MEPKGECPALLGPYRIDRTAVPKKEASSIFVFSDAVTILDGIQIFTDELLPRYMKESGNRCDFLITDIDIPWIPRTASAALLALKTDTLVKEIPSVLQDVEDISHQA